MTQDEYIRATMVPGPLLSNVHEADRETVAEAVHRLDLGEPQTFEYRALLPDGEVRFIREIEEPVFDEDGKMVAAVGTSVDLTDLRNTEIQLRHAQRIEAIGAFTGGVAHDFNNLLAIILGNLELTLEDDVSEDQQDLIQGAIRAAKRGADLTQNLLSFARRAHLEPKRINLNQLIQDTMTWANRVLPETERVETSLMAGLWEVELDATSADSALINLLLNARDAIADGGKITIETANMRIEDEYISDRAEDIEPGRYVMLAVSDTGRGIEPHLLNRIFEPFYSGKPVGQGSGLGLSMVHGFIKQSKGAIRVYSEFGVGTTFTLFFKAADKNSAKENRKPATPIDRFEGQAKVLLAEDEEEVATMLHRVLTSAGYAMTVAKNGDEALKIFNSHDGFDLLLTDVVMPGNLQGPALGKAIRAINPDLPCIFLSGYAADATAHGNGLKPTDIRLMKPVGRKDLLRAVVKALQVADLTR